MATETLDPQQQDEAPDVASAEELESLYNLPSAQEPVYTHPGNQPVDEKKESDKPQDVEKSWYKPGGGEEETRDNLASAEDTVGESSGGSLYKRQHDASHGPGGLEKLRQNLFVTNRRRTIAGGGLVGTIIALLFGFSVFQGPLQLVHLSQILQRSFSRNENSINIRNRGLLRYARSGNIEETRLSKLGSIVYNKTLSQLSEQGIDFQTSKRGVPDSMTIDTSKNDNYKDLNPEEKKAAILEDFKISDPAILSETKPGSGVYKVNLTNTTLKGIDFVKATAKTAIGSLGNGKIEEGLATRYVKRAWDLPGLFSPYDKLKSVLKNKFTSSVAERQEAQKLEEEALTAEEAKVVEAPAAEAAKVDLKKKLGVDTLTKLVIAQALLCSIRAAANSAVIVNRATIVAPSAIQAADKTAKGAQIQHGSNFDLTQLDATTSSFYDPATKTTIWDAKSLQALSGSTDPGGKDIPLDLAQAFSEKTTADSIRNAINFKVLGIDLTGAACSTGGQLVGIALAIVVALTTIPSDGATAGGYAAWVASQAASTVVFGGVIYVLQHHLTEILEDKAIVPAITKGAVGGNVLAYGSRELANISARSMGGIALPGTESTVLAYDDQQAEQKQWLAESPVKRLLDVKDNRSAISKFIDNANVSPNGIIGAVAHPLLNFGSMFRQSVSVLVPKTLAANTQYNWSFPQYGIPSSITEDPQFQNPYDNADQIAALLDAQCLNSDGTTKAFDQSITTYCDRAKACFGVDINKDGGLWQVVANDDVNPYSDEYDAGNCNDSGETWTRIRLFIFDSRLMDTVACYQNDEDSCANLDEGQNSTTANSQPSTTSSGTVDNGTNSQLAQKILDYQKTGQYHCDNSGDCTDLQKIVAGESLAGSSGCQAQSLDPRVLKLILYAIEVGGFKVGTFAFCGDHRFDSPTGHSGGFAVDFSTINGVAVSATNAKSTTLKFDQFVSGIKNELAPRQLISGGYGDQSNDCSGGFYDAQMQALEIPSSTTFGGNGGDNACHRNHVHVGY